MGEEVTADVIDGPQSRAWDQAENRKHTIKAIMLATLGKEVARSLSGFAFSNGKKCEKARFLSIFYFANSVMELCFIRSP